jgi:DNA-binding winged helix-turn-helix (wHTH) protein
MKKLKNIIVIESDKYFFAMLKGYCYANNITLKQAKFNLDGLNELKKMTPALIVFSLDWASTNNSFNEALRRAGIRSQLKLCGLNKNKTDIIPFELLEWIDVIISDQFDISSIDSYIKRNFLLGSGLTEDRRLFERRTFTDRRRIEINNKDNDVYKETGNRNYQQESRKLKFKKFKIDHRNRSLLLNEQEINLSPKEFELIELLLTDVDRVFKVDEIVNHLWPENNRATKSDLYQYMHLLRKKIEKDDPQLIINVKGLGYKLNLGNSEVL